MTTSTETNTIECVKLDGKITYEANYPKSLNDLDTRLINVLGNKNELVAAGATLGLKEGQVFTINVNNNPNSAQTFQIVKLQQNPLLTGFTGAILKNVTVGSDDFGKTILWADGSKGFGNLFNLKSLNPLNAGQTLQTAVELVNDWLGNDALGIGSGSIFPQLQSLKDFALDYLDDATGNKINVGIGQSMMGVGMSALGLTQGFGGMQVRAYSGCVSDDLRIKIATTEGWGLNDKNGSNIKVYNTPGEPLTNAYKPYTSGAIDFYMKGSTTSLGLKAHGATAYNNIDGQNSNYYQIQFDESAGAFKDGLATVKLNNKWGCINMGGIFIIPPKFDDARSFGENLAKVGIIKE